MQEYSRKWIAVHKAHVTDKTCDYYALQLERITSRIEEYQAHIERINRESSKIVDLLIDVPKEGHSHLFDDKLIVYYNLKDSKQVTYIELLDSTTDAEMDATIDSTSSLAVHN